MIFTVFSSLFLSSFLIDVSLSSFIIFSYSSEFLFTSYVEKGLLAINTLSNPSRVMMCMPWFSQVSISKHSICPLHLHVHTENSFFQLEVNSLSDLFGVFLFTSVFCSFLYLTKLIFFFCYSNFFFFLSLYFD